MIKCVSENCDYFKQYSECCSVCQKNGYKKVITNYDRIKEMSIDEMASFMGECGHDFPPYCDMSKAINSECDSNCFECAKKWLESEVEE